MKSKPVKAHTFPVRSVGSAVPRLVLAPMPAARKPLLTLVLAPMAATTREPIRKLVLADAGNVPNALTQIIAGELPRRN